MTEIVIPAQRDSAATPPDRAGAGFRVDPDGMRAAITILDQVIDRLKGTLRHLTFYGRIEPPGADHVSARIASNTKLMFDNAHEYIRVLTDQTEAARNTLQAQLDAYQRADDPSPFRA